jgi:transposase-like protein
MCQSDLPGDECVDEYDEYAYRDKDLLEELYVNQRLPGSKIADRLGCHTSTVNGWLNKHEVIRPYQDRDILHELYHERGYSLREVASELDCACTTILTWLEKHNLETRDHLETISTNHASFYTGTDGYEAWSGSGNECVRVHQLLAIANGYDPHDVFGGENHVHHINGVKWANWHDNIELLTASDHFKGHTFPDEDILIAVQKAIESGKSPVEGAAPRRLINEHLPLSRWGTTDRLRSLVDAGVLEAQNSDGLDPAPKQTIYYRFKHDGQNPRLSDLAERRRS